MPTMLLRHLRVIVPLCLVIGLCAGEARALTVLPADFGEMIAGSQVIVHGRVVDVRSDLTAGRRSIESVVTLAVIDAMKGEAGREVMFRMPGGRVGRYRRIVVGAPQFAPGQEVIVFLSGRAPALPMPFGLNQGVYRVTQGIVRGDPSRHPLGVADFVRQVRSVAGGGR